MKLNSDSQRPRYESEKHMNGEVKYFISLWSALCDKGQKAAHSLKLDIDIKLKGSTVNLSAKMVIEPSRMKKDLEGNELKVRRNSNLDKLKLHGTMNIL